MTISIYKISNNFDDKIYIGQTSYSLSHRFSMHAVKSSTCHKLRNAIHKYGRENFTIELLTTCEGQECADCIETFYIAANNSVENGYNIMNIGKKPPSPRGRKHSKETKAKMSASHKGKGVSHSNGWAGRKHSDETKKKMSESKKNRLNKEII